MNSSDKNTEVITYVFVNQFELMRYNSSIASAILKKVNGRNKTFTNWLRASIWGMPSISVNEWRKKRNNNKKKYAEYKQTDKKLLPECKHHDETMKFRLLKICRSFSNLSVVEQHRRKSKPAEMKCTYSFIHFVHKDRHTIIYTTGN